MKITTELEFAPSQFGKEMIGVLTKLTQEGWQQHSAYSTEKTIMGRRPVTCRKYILTREL